jgi:hypothetical protein
LLRIGGCLNVRVWVNVCAWFNVRLRFNVWLWVNGWIWINLGVRSLRNATWWHSGVL